MSNVLERKRLMSGDEPPLPWWKKSTDKKIATMAYALSAPFRQTTDEDIQVAKERVRREEEERDKLLNDIKVAESLVLRDSKIVYPDYENVHPLSLANRGLPIAQLFYFLDIPDEKLHDVFEFNSGSSSYTGKFVEGGIQNLATMLDKSIVVHSQVELGFPSIAVYSPTHSAEI